jgi:hypothetical protein
MPTHFEENFTNSSHLSDSGIALHFAACTNDYGEAMRVNQQWN